MKAVKLVLLFALLLLSAIATSAYTFDSQVIKYNIVDNKIFVQAVMNFTQRTSGSVALPMPPDAETVEIYLDGKKANISSEGVVNLESSTQEIKLSYITQEYLDKSNFLLNLPIEHDTDFLRVVVVLPEEAVLKKPIKHGSGTIYPKPDKSGTDGRSLIFIWEKENLKPGDEFSVFVMYKQKRNLIPVVVLLAAVICVLAYVSVYKKPKKVREVVIHRARAEEKAPEKLESQIPNSRNEVSRKKEEEDITEHLKEDEQQIVRVLRQRDRHCEQGTLRIVTGFSKAHLSRLLMELEARKVVFKEKRGKKNVVFLK